ncbi:hypothetical protein R1flu_021581 [Riccia fluitans]|uniref:G-patch domain-containing protein n=1 Tax=Riccia fluitans TaxID=41844 RepID=A0ABD1ZPT7_9MARC
MADSSDGSRELAMRFLREESLELAVSTSSSFVKSSEAYEGSSKFKAKGARNTSGYSQATSASIFSELTGLPMNMASSEVEPQAGRTKRKTLSEANIGFKLLKKSGWKEGSGLGASEQGRLNPVEAEQKLDRRGIGAERKYSKRRDGTTERGQSDEDERETKKSKQEKNMARRALKKQAEAERMQEAAFAREFHRQFWPENV